MLLFQFLVLQVIDFKDKISPWYVVPLYVFLMLDWEISAISFEKKPCNLTAKSFSIISLWKIYLNLARL